MPACARRRQRRRPRALGSSLFLQVTRGDARASSPHDRTVTLKELRMGRVRGRLLSSASVIEDELRLRACGTVPRSSLRLINRDGAWGPRQNTGALKCVKEWARRRRICATRSRRSSPPLSPCSERKTVSLDEAPSLLRVSNLTTARSCRCKKRDGDQQPRPMWPPSPTCDVITNAGAAGCALGIQIRVPRVVLNQ